MLFYQYFSGTAPLGTSFIAGFFAPRASYLLGAIIALASVGFQAIVFLGPFGNGFFDLQTQTTAAPVSKDALVQSILTNALFAGVPSGAFFAAAAAWYRRFLRLASPNRQAQSRASSGKRPDGKVPKKNESRPILARRRYARTQPPHSGVAQRPDALRLIRRRRPSRRPRPAAGRRGR